MKIFAVILILLSIISINNTNTIYYHVYEDYENKEVLVTALNKIINETINNTSVIILNKMKILVKMLDNKTLSKLVYYIQDLSINEKGYKNKSNNLEIMNYFNYSRIKINNSKQSIMKNSFNNNMKHNNRSTTFNFKANPMNPMLIIINVISIASFIIGLYIFRIIKKRIDYI